MSRQERAPDEDEETGKEGSQGGQSSGGGPALKPDASLFDPEQAISDAELSATGSVGSGARAGKSPSTPPKTVGDWQFHFDDLLIFNSRHRKKLLLSSLDTPTKMTKLIIALGSQEEWEADNLIKILDVAAKKRFNKSLYEVLSLAHDTSSIDWKTGAIRSLETEKIRRSGF